MYKLYFKQAIEMLKQNKFISMIAITGTALAIMMIMSIIVVDEIKNISIAPESNRYRTYYINGQIVKDTVWNSWNSGWMDYKIYRDYLVNLPTPEYVSITSYYNGESFIGRPGSEETSNINLRRTDASFWKIMNFHFMEGRPYGQEEYDSGMAYAIISESTARKTFKGEKAIGEIITIDSEPYLVTGIVKDVSPIFDVSFGDVWIPISSQERFMRNNGYLIFLTIKDEKDLQRIRQELKDVEKKYGINNKDKVLILRGPDSHRVYRMNIDLDEPEEVVKSLKTQNRKQILILLMLLLVPAINLSGLSFSRIKKRTAEIGVRKAFGAKKYVILIQVLYENLITSLIGGILGLVLSYGVVTYLKNWLLKIPADSVIPGEAFISFPVFLMVFIVCVLINLLSAGIPAYRASKMSIVNSINENDK